MVPAVDMSPLSAHFPLLNSRQTELMKAPAEESATWSVNRVHVPERYQNNLNIAQSHRCDSETKDRICNHFPHSHWKDTQNFFSEVADSQFSIPDKYLWLKRSGRVQTHNDLNTRKVFWCSERSRLHCVHCASPGLQGKIYCGNVSKVALNGCYTLIAKFHIFFKMRQKKSRAFKYKRHM